MSYIKKYTKGNTTVTIETDKDQTLVDSLIELIEAIRKDEIGGVDEEWVVPLYYENISSHIKSFLAWYNDPERFTNTCRFCIGNKGYEVKASELE